MVTLSVFVIFTEHSYLYSILIVFKKKHFQRHHGLQSVWFQQLDFCGVGWIGDRLLWLDPTASIRCWSWTCPLERPGRGYVPWKVHFQQWHLQCCTIVAAEPGYPHSKGNLSLLCRHSKEILLSANSEEHSFYFFYLLCIYNFFYRVK